MTAIGYPRFRSVRKGGQHNGSVDTDLSLCFKVVVTPHPLV